MDHAPTAPDTDQLIAGRYRVTDAIARGGMAVVYRAHDERLGRDVAVKVVDLRSDLDGRSRERISLEAKRAASLRHPNIVSVHDAGTDEERAFIVMELVGGEPLADVLEERGQLSEQEAAVIGAQVCRALGEAHRHGIVHRDIKPSNVLVDEDARVEVTDFGIARANEGDTVTEHAPMGSAPYIAPEQLSGGSVDGRADLYALGVVLYEAVTGRLPFSGDTATATAWQRLHRPPEAPQAHADLPAGLGAVIERALERDPDDRYGSAEEMRVDLDRVARSRDADTAPLPVIEAGRRSPAWRTAAVGAFILVLAVAGLLAVRTGTFESTAATEVAVPQVTGVSLDAAERLLRVRDLRIGEVDYVASDRPVDTVLSQQPGPRTDVAPGTAIDLTVSAGTAELGTTTPSSAPRIADRAATGSRAEDATTGDADAVTDEPGTEPTERPRNGPPDEAPGRGTPPGHADPDDRPGNRD